MPLTAYIRVLFYGSLAATAVLVLGRFGVLTDDQFEAAYAPAVWACYKVPGFVLAHEAWIEAFALGRVVWSALRIAG